MTHRIITGYVETPGGRDALALGAGLADLDPSAEWTVARVYLYNPPAEAEPPAGWRNTLRDAAEGELAAARARYGTRERTSFTAACGVSPADGLHRLADELAADIITVGVSHTEGLGRVLAGSATEQTLHGAPCAVAVAPKGYAARESKAVRTVACAFNGSEESERALALAAAIAAEAGARLRILSVVEQGAVWYGGYMGPGAALDVREFVGEELELARQRHAGAVDDVTVELLDGEPVAALSAAAASADLLVLGSRGHGPLRRVLLGSVSSRLVREPACPLLVVPRGSQTWANGTDDSASSGEGARSGGDVPQVSARN
jgi:nucleotide-binding universal stress UspA family protein